MRRYVLLALLLSSGAEAQKIKVVSLGPADARLEEEFTAITSVRELRDGRVLITDPQEGRLVVADLRSGKVEPVSRRGDGPGEYAMAAPLRALGGDSSVMVDLIRRRWLLLDGAKVVATLSPQTKVIVATQGFAMGIDALGHAMATRGTPPKPGISETGKGDSVVVILVERRSGSIDTIARLRPRPSVSEIQVGQDGKISSANFRSAPLTVGEQALLFLDGWLAIARIEPYRVDWRAPDGKWVHGAPLPIPLIRMTDREKRASTNRAAKNSGQPAKSPQTITDWPATLPPFAASLNTLLASPDKRLLILHQKSADHPETIYDVIDRRGVLLGQVTMPENERIVGFGAGSVYVVTKDSDDIERLKRHPWPVDHPILP